MIILDLDDTIFETKSMNPRIFDPAISIVKRFYLENETEQKANRVVDALWSDPIDLVFKNHHTPSQIVENFFEALEEINFKALRIQPYTDYTEIKSLKHPKVLVTTGYTKLQSAKINALQIASDFDTIYIDDPRSYPRLHKFGIFKQILDESKCKASDIWVIGDNPNSEILSGKKLGMRTIQRKTSKWKKSEFADYMIESFTELKEILQ